MDGSNAFFTSLQKEIANSRQKQGELFADDNGEERDLFGAYDEYDEVQDEITELRTEKKELSSENQILQQKSDEHYLRISTFRKLFYLMVAWLVANFSIIILSGSDFWIGGWHFSLKLSDIVLMTLLGTTTFNVLGIFAIAAKWLFPKKT